MERGRMAGKLEKGDNGANFEKGEREQ